MTVEEALNNFQQLLNLENLVLNKRQHVALDQSLQLLREVTTPKEAKEEPKQEK